MNSQGARDSCLPLLPVRLITWSWWQGRGGFCQWEFESRISRVSYGILSNNTGYKVPDLTCRPTNGRMHGRMLRQRSSLDKNPKSVEAKPVFLHRRIEVMDDSFQASTETPTSETGWPYSGPEKKATEGSDRYESTKDLLCQRERVEKSFPFVAVAVANMPVPVVVIYPLDSIYCERRCPSSVR